MHKASARVRGSCHAAMLLGTEETTSSTQKFQNTPKLDLKKVNKIPPPSKKQINSQITCIQVVIGLLSIITVMINYI